MSRRHKHSNQLLETDVSPRIAEEKPTGVLTNSVRKEQGCDELVLAVHHEDTYRAVPRKIHVLFVITGLASGGATNVVLDLASHFNNHSDFEVQLLTGPIPPGRTDVTYLAHEMGINTRLVPSLINHINPVVNLKAVADIRRIMRQGNYDIVHTHSSVAGVIGRIAAFSAGVPVVLHHVHGWGLHARESQFTQRLYVNLERLCARFTTQMIVVSRPDIQKGLAHRIGREDQYTLVYNGIDLERFRQPLNDNQMHKKLGLDPDCKHVGMIGRLDGQKNPLDFIRAAATVISRYPKVQFLIVGDGQLRPDCERLIDELNLRGKFFLLGYKNDVPRIISLLTITAMSSLWEGLPIAFLESMSAGKPIVANNVDGASDVVIDGETGFLVTPRQPREMAERILYLLNNENLCSEMGQVAQQRSNYFSKDRMVAQVESLYKGLHFAAQRGNSCSRRE